MKFVKYISLIFLALMMITTSPRAENATPEKVTIAQFGKERFLLYLPLYLAMEEGLFAKRGLNIDLKFAGLDDQVFATVISGSAQFGVGDPVFTAISHDKGGPGKVVAMMVQKLTNVGMTKNPEIPVIKKPSDLNGLRVSSLPEPSTTYTILDGIKRANGLDMTILQAPIDGQIALVETGKADIGLALEPAAAKLEDKGYRAVFNLAEWAEPQAITGFTTTEDYIKNHPQTVQKIVEGLQDSIDLMYRHPESAYRLAQKMYPDMPEKSVRRAVDRMLKGGAFPHAVAIDDNVWQRTLKTRLDSGEMKKPQATDVVVDNTFALKTKAAGGTAK